MENMIYSDEFIKELFERIKADDLEFLKNALSQDEELKRLKMGCLPLVSVATLFAAEKCVDFLLPFFADTNAYIEADAPEELREKLENLFAESTLFESVKEDSADEENSAYLSELYEDARFIEPSELALLAKDFSLANRILSSSGIKTLTARKRLEAMQEKSSVFELSEKNGKVKIFDKNAKKKITLSKKGKTWLFIFAFAICISIIVPLVVLTAMRVKVTYYSSSTDYYGYEQGLKGGKITITQPEKEGYTFDGWYMDKQKIDRLPQKSGNAYASWKANEYTITFDLGAVEIENEIEREYSGKYDTSIDLPIPNAEGKLFLGWYDDSGEMIKSNVIKKDQVFHARFADFENNSLENPYEIKEQSEFLYLCNQEGYFTIKEDILIDENYISSGSLCDSALGFAGHLDGQGRKIIYKGSNPLFMKIANNGSIENLDICARTSVYLIDYVYSDRFGVLCALNSGLLQNVTVRFESFSSEKGESVSGIHGVWYLSYVGVLAGSNSGRIVNATVEGNCSLTTGSHLNMAYWGGIVGANIGEVENSKFSASAELFFANRSFGGIVGYNSGKITNCQNDGKLEFSEEKPPYTQNTVLQIGGIAGANGTTKTQSDVVRKGEIENCLNLASIRINKQSMELYVGGISAYSESVLKFSENQGEIIVLDCLNTVYAGGVVGFSASRGYGEITNCTNKKAVNLSSRSIAYLGGIAGYVISSDSSSKLKVFNCVNEGNLLNGTQTGGVAGFAVNSSFEKCENKGNIEVTDGNDEVVKAIGGLIGGGMDSEIQRSFNRGNITISGLEQAEKANYLGGLVADNVDIRIVASASFATLVYGEKDIAGLLCAVMNSIDGEAEVNNSYALTDGRTPSFYAYNSTTNQNGDYVDPSDNNLKKPKLYADDKGLAENEEEIYKLLGINPLFY